MTPSWASRSSAPESDLLRALDEAHGIGRLVLVAGGRRLDHLHCLRRLDVHGLLVWNLGATSHTDFMIRGCGGEIFSDGFESGNTSRWE